MKSNWVECPRCCNAIDILGQGVKVKEGYVCCPECSKWVEVK
jgi:hypothetical protein